jgi:hypothetical protein
MINSSFKELNLRREKRFGQAAALFGLIALLLESNFGFAGDTALTRYQVEAIFLFNFTKYVDWPPAAFPNAAAPIAIGVLGADPFGDNLQHIVEGKTVNGRPFVIKHLASDSEFNGCHILFICHSEESRMEEILGKTGALPVLTVGEDEQFDQNGCIINFVLKNGNVRLQIDLAAARKAGLTISSRLLAVADTVNGKSN